ncbi:efflux RND transporter periplasmic adaptor subunit [Frigoriglobus tundricola]|uniref:RND efflux system, membrane fusion protein n=1 Tax=Frigoriglobus tundricola TaxID=2774151 RepID=A0A6M5YIP0_9BACT|nr:efflux RND transporter periplasmic adaptor subunit [Frigoriglobus tundricola]QJW93939.1 RND efflux system, membrane fusion protein [Frigoriglobus tundricola]
MENTINTRESGSPNAAPNSGWRVIKTWLGVGVVVAGSAAAAVWNKEAFAAATEKPAPPAPPLVSVAVSPPLQHDVEAKLQFLGQFSGVEHLEIRAQVGGTLAQISFKDGDVVKKGDLLFVIDPEPYEIRLSQAKAQLESAKARVELAEREMERAETSIRAGVDSRQTYDQRVAERHVAVAAVAAAEALIRDARFDLGRTRITAPFSGRIGTHLVSVGNLIAGSRAAGSPTTLLATLVSLESVYLNFDMSEADYMAFLRARGSQPSPLADTVEISLSDETTFSRTGTLDFLDNALNRSSGTIRARATVPNSDLLLRPGGFARVRVALGPAAPGLLVPDSAVLPDQSQHVVMTVGTDGTVAPKVVKVGDLRGGLRVVRSGLDPTDRVVVEGIPTVRPGQKVATTAGAIRLNPGRD